MSKAEKRVSIIAPARLALKKHKGVSLEYEAVPAVSYAVYHCGVPVIKSLSIKNNSRTAFPACSVSIEIPGYSDTWQQEVKKLAPGEEIIIPQPQVKLRADRLVSLEDSTSADLVIAFNGEVFKERIRIFGLYQWSLEPGNRKFLACFVQPGHLYVQHIVLDAQNYLKCRGMTSFALLIDSKLPDRTACAMQALYMLLAMQYSIHYVHEPLCFEQGHQVIRPPHAALQRLCETGGQEGLGQGTCIDLAVLLAACLESTGLQPLIIVLRSDAATAHALLGCWRSRAERFEPILSDGKKIKNAVTRGDIIVLEATGCTDISTKSWRRPLSFKDARDKAEKMLQGGGFVFALDIAAARKSVAPLQSNYSPALIRVLRQAEQFARDEASPLLETRHVFYSLLDDLPRHDAGDSKTIQVAFKSAGVDPSVPARLADNFRERIALPAGNNRQNHGAIPRPTENYRQVIYTAEHILNLNEHIACLPVDRLQLLFALLLSRSQSIDHIVKGLGTNRERLKSCLEPFFNLHMSIVPHEDSGLPGAQPPLLLKIFLNCCLSQDASPLGALPSEFEPAIAARTPIPESAYRTGDLLGGRWKVLAVIGKGGQAVVYLALDMAKGELVAVKELTGHAGTPAQIDEAARQWIRLGRHPHILEAKDVLRVGDSLLISMEYLPAPADMKSCTLSDWLLKTGALEQDRIFSWAIQFCRGMEHAYKKGITVHGDIKPGNILIDAQEQLKIADFGLAAGTSTPCGSLRYMASELFEGSAKPGRRSDIYSFGIVLFYMVTGKYPYCVDVGQYLATRDYRQALHDALHDAHCAQQAPDPCSPLSGVIQKCMEKNPGRRYASFMELREELETLCRQHGQLPAEVTALPQEHALTSDDEYRKGSQLLGLGLYRDAEQCFDRALSEEHRNPDALQGKAVCLFGRELYREAGKLFTRVLKLNSSAVASQLGKGLCLHSMKQYEAAERIFSAASEASPNQPAVWFFSGLHYSETGVEEKALKCYYRALDPLVSQKRKEEALEIVRHALAAFPLDKKLNQLYGLILRLREKNLDWSRKILEALPDELKNEPETLGILAGTYKRLWLEDRHAHADMLERACNLYVRAWELSKKTNTYPGINAATLLLILGREEESRKTAREVKMLHEKCLQERLSSLDDVFSSYWDRVTLAEAELLLGNIGAACRLYRDSMSLYTDKSAWIDSTKDQIKLILPCLGLSIGADEFLGRPLAGPLQRAMRIGITGHRSLGDESALAEKISREVAGLRKKLAKDISFEVISPLARGADCLAAEVLLAKFKARLRVPLPRRAADYIHDFEELPSDARSRVQALLDQAEQITRLPAAKRRGSQYCNTGKYVVDHCDVLLALWDGKPAKGRGGTADIVKYARGAGRPLIWINTGSPHDISRERMETITGKNFLKGRIRMYKPKPIDTAHVQLGDDLHKLTELLAENAHDIWGKKRMEDGWTWGPERDDTKKKHPDLIPYRDLPVSEKGYDREMALETLKVIKAMGYRIEKI